jgi:uncharacterized protein YyaL (SSP411 family)
VLRWITIAIAAGAVAWLAHPSTGPRGGSGASARLAAFDMTASDPHRHPPNHLVHEKSPYLLQHAYNPVDWYPWGEEAFAKARREGKPIFLSIGYSTCHWCHVMERESFENDSVAELLNRDFVAIKVDREERPDVDRIYMTAMQGMGMGGGWPLNVFLTPSLDPFYGGTYFPPTSRGGHAGLTDLLPRIHEAWSTRRAEIESTGAKVIGYLAAMSAPDSASASRDRIIASAYATLQHSHDAEHGGFGTAPKFPSTVNLNFLLRLWARDPARYAAAKAVVTAQLDAMRAGGIHDHLGGGFHRYATDRVWLVPHFEKMLYDQAQIAWAYLEGYTITRNEAYAATARDVFAYVARDMTSPEGAFYSAEDADSEGREGRFYVWTLAQLESALGAGDAALVVRRYGVTPHGNFEGGASILSEVETLDETARALGIAPAEAGQRLAEARAKLLAARSKRVRPHRDDKVLAAWNGLMISALARGARVLGDPRLAERGARAADFVWERMRDPKTGELRRRWRDGEAAGAGQLDDYAYYALGCFDLYQATFDPKWLERATLVTEAEIARFWDETGGGFFESPAGDPAIKVRMKDGFDGAEMAGNSIAAWNLEMLAALLDREDWREKARRTLDYYGRRLAGAGAAMPQMLVAMLLESATPRHLVIAGRPEAPDTQAMLSEYDRRFLPHDAVLLVDGGERQRRLAKLVPFVAALAPKDGRATAYVCVNYACRLPTTDPAAFGAQLDEREAHVAARGKAQ